MIEMMLYAVPVYLAIGVGMIACVIAVTPRDQRPDFFEAVSIGLVAMICWPMLVWAFFHEERGE